MKKLYLAGDIMNRGAYLQREEEYEKLNARGLDFDIYSPVLNKSINDKTGVTEEENNHLAEKITQADIDRMFESDVVVIEPLQQAIGTLCEYGCLFGWKYLAKEMDKCKTFEDYNELKHKMLNKEVYTHYSDIRTNHLNEKDWRRSFGINQLLYGMILATDKLRDIHEFSEIVEFLEAEDAYKNSLKNLHTVAEKVLK